MIKYKNNQLHNFHLVDPSPWPLFTAFSALIITFGGVLYMHGYVNGWYILKYGFFFFNLAIFGWWQDVIREATFEGQHTISVQKSLKIGMILFIVSEIMFFFAFFWAFFHSSFNPSIFIGGVWPPRFLIVLSPWGLPLLNTFLLLSSGATITATHHFIRLGDGILAIKFLNITIFLAICFLYVQFYEYLHSPFSISDGIYGSTFFMLTGFHGFHVLIGTIFIYVQLNRLASGHFTRSHHFGFEASAWYWHFVDIVWIFLFIIVYWWGGSYSK